MSKRGMGGPAFPNGRGRAGEVTLWDYYAAHCPTTKIDLAMKSGGSVSGACAAHADAMLRERAKRQESHDE